MPKISVVLPTFNGEIYLAQSIDSVVAQTFKDWELILVNDGSTDHTREIAEQYIKNDSRIKLINNSQNQKLPASLNIGFAQAAGEFLTWTSDDNRYLPDALKTMYEYLCIHKDRYMVCADMELIDANGKKAGEAWRFHETGMFHHNCVGACFLYKRDVLEEIGGYDPEMFLVEDYAYWLEIIKRYGRIGHIDTVLYQYRFHHKSLTATKLEQVHKQLFRLQKKNLDWILEQLKEDREYICRMYYEFLEANEEVRTIEERFFQYVPELRLDTIPENNKPVIIWGEGEYGERAAQNLKGRAVYLIENDTRKAGESRYGLMALSKEKLLEIHQDYTILIAVSCKKIFAVIRFLYSHGIFAYSTWQKRPKMQLLIFGTGDYYERYKKWFAAEEIVALLDNSPEKQNTYIDGIHVLSPQEGSRLAYDAVVILSFYVKEMRRQLVELGILEKKIYHFYELHGLLKGRTVKRPIEYYGGAETVIESGERTEKKILLLSHDLSLGGPPIALFHMAKVLIKQGYSVVYASMINGPLKERLLSEKIPVVIDVNLQLETMREAEWTGKFSFLVCNTINYHVFLSDRDNRIPVIWWLHDAPFFYDGIKRPMLEKLRRTNLTVCSVGPVPERALRGFLLDIKVEELLYGVPDREGASKRVKNRQDQVCFVTIGDIGAVKGQDILVQAVRKLPSHICKKGLFYLVGRDSSAMAKRLRRETGNLPEIVMTGSVGREEIHALLERADVLICPSREDSMPTVAAEAMMHGVPCIVSDAAGTAAYLHEGEDGFIFHKGNVEELSEKIIWCIRNRERLPEIGQRSRTIYEKYFSMLVFENRLLKLIKRAQNKKERVQQEMGGEDVGSDRQFEEI